MSADVTTPAGWDEKLSLQLFAGYEESDLDIIREFANSAAKPEPGFITDFLGVRTRTSSVWSDARILDGKVIGLPIPADFHAEAVEWIGTLKAVKSAKNEFVGMELGAGFGPWMVASATAAKSRGIREIRLYAVEGDPHHFAYLNQHFADNGFPPQSHHLMEAAVGARDGVAQWPVVDEGTHDWGMRPMSGGAEYRGASFAKTKSVPVISMGSLIRRETRWDLIHIDVQGHEVDICSSCIRELNNRVAWMVVGTHSRKLDGDLLQLMTRAGWILEHEKPSRFAFRQNPPTIESMTITDGTQVWRNPRFVRYSEQERPPNTIDEAKHFARRVRRGFAHRWQRISQLIGR